MCLIRMNVQTLLDMSLNSNNTMHISKNTNLMNAAGTHPTSIST